MNGTNKGEGQSPSLLDVQRRWIKERDGAATYQHVLCVVITATLKFKQPDIDYLNKIYSVALLAYMQRFMNVYI